MLAASPYVWLVFPALFIVFVVKGARAIQHRMRVPVDPRIDELQIVDPRVPDGYLQFVGDAAPVLEELGFRLVNCMRVEVLSGGSVMWTVIYGHSQIRARASVIQWGGISNTQHSRRFSGIEFATECSDGTHLVTSNLPFGMAEQISERKRAYWFQETRDIRTLWTLHQELGGGSAHVGRPFTATDSVVDWVREGHRETYEREMARGHWRRSAGGMMYTMRFLPALRAILLSIPLIRQINLYRIRRRRTTRAAQLLEALDAK